MTRRSGWAAGWNQPGYMPETEAAWFPSWADACRYLVEELEREAERLADATPEDDSFADDAEEQARFLREDATPNRPVTVNAGGYAWWIEQAEGEESSE